MEKAHSLKEHKDINVVGRVPYAKVDNSSSTSREPMNKKH